MAEETTPVKPNWKVLIWGSAAMVVVLGGLYALHVRKAARQAGSVNADEAQVIQEGRKAKDRADQQASSIQAQGYGQGLQFDAQGNLQGAKVQGSDLPSNATVQDFQKKDKDGKSAWGSPSASDAVNAGIDGDAGQSGFSSGSSVGIAANANPDTMREARQQAKEDRQIYGGSMLAYSAARASQDGSSAAAPGGNGVVTPAAFAGGDAGQGGPSLGAIQNSLMESGRANGSFGPQKAAATGAADMPMRSLPGQIADMRIGGGPEVTVHEGQFLDCVLQHDVESSFNDSPIMAMVARDFLSPDGRYVLIPAGTMVPGLAGKVQNVQQARLFISFSRALFPDGRSAYFPERLMPLGMTADGTYGVMGKVNHHWLLQYGAAVMLGVVDGLAASTQGPISYSPISGAVSMSAGQLAVQQTSQQLQAVTQKVMDRYGNVVPTVRLKAGSRIKIYFTEDVRLNAYMPSRDLRWVQHEGR